jgi:hypothetical protein
LSQQQQYPYGFAFGQVRPVVGSPPSTPDSDIGSRFFVESESFAPTAIAAGSGSATETTQTAGTEALNIGYLVEGLLNGGPTALTTAADTLAYICIKGRPSKKYYAVAFVQQIVGFNFTIALTDRIDIVTANQDTAAHTMTGYWQATRPGVIPR